MIEETFRKDAKQIVDLCFETKLLKEDVTRDTMNSFEDLISFMLQSRYDTYVKINKLFKK